VGNGGLALGPEDLHVEVDEAADDGGGQAQAGLHVQGHPLQVVVERAVLVVVGDEPELGAGVPRRHVRGDEAWTGRSARTMEPPRSHPPVPPGPHSPRMLSCRRRTVL